MEGGGARHRGKRGGWWLVNGGWVASNRESRIERVESSVESRESKQHGTVAYAGQGLPPSHHLAERCCFWYFFWQVPIQAMFSF